MPHPEQHVWVEQRLASVGADVLLPAAAMANVATIASAIKRVRMDTHLLSRYGVESVTGVTGKHTPPLLRKNGLRSLDGKSQIRSEEMNIGMSCVAGGLLVGMQEAEVDDPAGAGDGGTTINTCNGGCSPTCRARMYAVVFPSTR